MTPKLKANELIDKMYFSSLKTTKKGASYCASIAINEIMEQLDEVRNITGSSYVLRMIDYWQDVKTEIEKL